MAIAALTLLVPCLRIWSRMAIERLLSTAVLTEAHCSSRVGWVTTDLCAESKVLQSCASTISCAFNRPVARHLHDPRDRCAGDVQPFIALGLKLKVSFCSVASTFLEFS